MNKLEFERKKMELKRVTMAKEELEFAIMERESDIERLRSNILIQEQKINELEEHIKSMEGKING